MVFHSPCELGDEVWIIDGNIIKHGIVEEFVIKKYGRYCKGSLYRDENNDGDNFEYDFGVNIADFDKTVFLNKIQAERALAARNSEEH